MNTKRVAPYLNCVNYRHASIIGHFQRCHVYIHSREWLWKETWAPTKIWHLSFTFEKNVLCRTNLNLWNSVVLLRVPYSVEHLAARRIFHFVLKLYCQIYSLQMKFDCDFKLSFQMQTQLAWCNVNTHAYRDQIRLLWSFRPMSIWKALVEKLGGRITRFGEEGRLP